MYQLPAVIIICLGMLLAACDNEPDTTEIPQLRLVRTLTVTSPEHNNWRELPGVVEAAQKADLGFRVGGKLEKMLVNEGDGVRKDQLLAQLDATDYTIQLNSRKAEYNQALADYERGKKLIKKNLISRSDYDKLKAQFEAAQANLDAAQQNLDYTKLRAPFAGRIARRYVENFEEVSARQPVYALQDLSEMTIRVDVPESIMIRVRRGAKPDVLARFDQIPDQWFPLTLKEVSTQANETTNTFEVTFSMPAVEGYNILPGMSVTVRGEPDHDTVVSDDVIHVPAHAVLEDENGRYVYVVDKTGDNLGVVERRRVSTGRLSNLGLEVTSGLDTGDEIVTAGMSKMYPGLEVRLEPETAR